MKLLERLIRCELRNLRDRRVMVLSLVVIGLILSAGLRAETYSSNPNKSLEDKLSAALSMNAGMPIAVESVDEAAAGGLLEVRLKNGLLVYATPDGDFFVVGDLYSVDKKGITNITEVARQGDRKAVIDAVPLEQMIIFSPEGEVRDYISVFTDTTCFYCQKLHREVGALNAMGIEVRYLAYPRAGLDSDGAKQLTTAWCAADKQDTFTKLKDGVKLPYNLCKDAPIAEQFELGASLGVRGTPAIFTSSGEMIPGYKPAAELARTLGLE